MLQLVIPLACLLAAAAAAAETGLEC